jgi:hypothetical protein
MVIEIDESIKSVIVHSFMHALEMVVGLWQHFLLLTYWSDTEQHNLAWGGRQEGM